MTVKLRLLLADDHAILREGLAALIQTQPDLEVVAQAGSGREAVRQARLHMPDIVVIDVSMPDIAGAQATDLIRQSQPEVRIVALTRHDDQGYLKRMFQAGASAYVLKRSAGEALITAIRAVSTGGTWIDPGLAGTLLTRMMGQGEPGAARLNPAGANLAEREEQVLKLIAWGQSNKEIAAELGISIKTVESYKATGLAKLNLRSRTDIVRHALACGWLGGDASPE
ncbi:MAG: response regulator transcription factor [Rubrivivax sp.]|nr:MAG: response regulator transcription factor [Rubrivivax sp.]